MKILTAQNVIIVVLVIVIIFMQECRHCPKSTETKVEVHDTTYKHFPPETLTVEKPHWYKVETTDTIPANVDTLAIIKDYLAKYYYVQTIKDTNLSVTITDTVTQNKIAGRGFSYQILKTQQIITNTTTITPATKTKMFAGLQLNGSKTQFGFAPSLAIETKKEHLYAIGYDVLNGSIQGSLYFKIKLKK